MSDVRGVSTLKRVSGVHASTIRVPVMLVLPQRLALYLSQQQ